MVIRHHSNEQIFSSWLPNKCLVWIPILDKIFSFFGSLPNLLRDPGIPGISESYTNHYICSFIMSDFLWVKMPYNWNYIEIAVRLVAHFIISTNKWLNKIQNNDDEINVIYRMSANDILSLKLMRFHNISTETYSLLLLK